MSAPPDGQPVLLPAHTPKCMGCGQDNPQGMKMAVYRFGDRVFSDITFDERHLGAPGLAHVGAIAAACDGLLGVHVVDSLKPRRSPAA